MLGRLHRMRIRQFIDLSAALVLALRSVLAAEFQNLNFEQATIPPTPVGQFGPLFADPALAFPGWTMGPSGAVNVNYTLYNNLTLGSVAHVLFESSYAHRNLHSFPARPPGHDMSLGVGMAGGIAPG